ncbi:hypothetical protein CRG98_004185 [Punica granatum]|uniref:DUF4283 domain-containing protein n=1 Tax=Punica granatum TaxID=22663 RepID=A0A2I0L476_PUNGR|nr:hypothetical protein CRG98_004185 [Punica granatum]
MEKRLPCHLQRLLNCLMGLFVEKSEVDRVIKALKPMEESATNIKEESAPKPVEESGPLVEVLPSIDISEEGNPSFQSEASNKDDEHAGKVDSRKVRVATSGVAQVVLKLSLTFVYASNSQLERKLLWDDLKSHATGVGGAWFLLGDLNAVLSLEEVKRDGKTVTKDSSMCPFFGRGLIRKVEAIKFDGLKFVYLEERVASVLGIFLSGTRCAS